MSSRSSIVLPDPLKQVLDLRATASTCRPEVEAAMKQYGLIRTAAPSVPAATNTTTKSLPAFPQRGAPTGRTCAPPRESGGGGGGGRFNHLGHCAAPDGWRSKNPPPVRQEEEDSWVSVSNKRRNQPFRRSEPNYNSVRNAGAGAASTISVTPSTPSSGAWRSTRFQPLEEAITTESMEDRIMGKVRAKVNKLGHSTYDATKAFMKQILDSGETEFLDEFMKFVFGKAATEQTFCGLYARFLHELSDEFPHLRSAMVNKFREYTRVFDEASKAPDVGTSDYVAFVEAQEQKKFRRGYSQFVAELAKLGEVSTEDFRLLVNQIVDTIRTIYTQEADRQLCEEVIDCFLMMVRAGNAGWMKEYLEVLRSVVKAPKETSPGLSNKGRFALMDLLDLVQKY